MLRELPGAQLPENKDAATLHTLEMSAQHLRYSASVLRRILRSFSRGVVLKRRLPKEFGRTPLFVYPEATLAYWRHDLCSVDPFLLSIAHELVRPSMSVWDVGANVGLFSFAAAALGANVLAIEPDTWLANLIHHGPHEQAARHSGSGRCVGLPRHRPTIPLR